MTNSLNRPGSLSLHFSLSDQLNEVVAGIEVATEHFHTDVAHRRDLEALFTAAGTKAFLIVTFVDLDRPVGAVAPRSTCHQESLALHSQ